MSSKTLDENISEQEKEIAELTKQMREAEKNIKEKQQNIADLKKSKRKKISSGILDNKDILELYLKHESICNDTFIEQHGFRKGYKIPKCSKCALHFLTENDLQNVDFSLTLRIVKDTA